MLHTDLPIYKTGVELLALAFRVQEQMPRGMKRHLGEKIVQHCIDMLDLMALANATQRAERAAVNSYFGLLRQASHSHADRTRLANATRRRGRCVSGDLTKTYRNRDDRKESR